MPLPGERPPPIRLWAARHSNGWETWVALHADGTCSSWACPAAEGATAIYIEDSQQYATAAALFDLRRLSGHGPCDPACGAWEERMAPVDHHHHGEEHDP